MASLLQQPESTGASPEDLEALLEKAASEESVRAAVAGLGSMPIAALAIDIANNLFYSCPYYSWSCLPAPALASEYFLGINKAGAYALEAALLVGAAVLVKNFFLRPDDARTKLAKFIQPAAKEVKDYLTAKFKERKLQNTPFTGSAILSLAVLYHQTQDLDFVGALAIGVLKENAGENINSSHITKMRECIQFVPVTDYAGNKRWGILENDSYKQLMSLLA